MDLGYGCLRTVSDNLLPIQKTLLECLFFIDFQRFVRIYMIVMDFHAFGVMFEDGK